MRGGGRADGHRPQVGEQAQRLAQGQQAVLGPLRPAVPLGAADRAQEDGVGLAAGLERLRRQRLAAGVDGFAADQVGGEVEAVAEAVGDHVQHHARGGGDFGADAVAGQQDDFTGLHDA